LSGFQRNWVNHHASSYSPVGLVDAYYLITMADSSMLPRGEPFKKDDFTSIALVNKTLVINFHIFNEASL
jgi:hypothetical protein